jgi:hypothetical protein
MKRLIAISLLLPIWVFAQGIDRVTETEKVIIKDGDNISVRSSVYKQERNREVFSDCEMRQWTHAWGVGTKVSCNWSEREAMNAALTHAPDGFKIEWYDDVKRQSGYTVVAWTRPMSDAGQCRDVEVVKQYTGSIDKQTYIMCYNGNRWQNYKGY